MSEKRPYQQSKSARSATGGEAVSGGSTSAGAVPLGPPATLRPLDYGESVPAVVADLPQLDSGEPAVDPWLVPVASVGPRVVGEVMQFEDGDPTAGGGVAVEGHVTDGGTNRYTRQGVRCERCGGSGRYLAQPGLSLRCRCPAGELDARATAAEKFPGSDPEMDSLRADAALAAMEGP